MHVMFIHPAFPAQFGHLATYLTKQHGWQCTYVTAADTRGFQVPFRQVNYQVSEEGLPPGYPPLATLPGLIRHMETVFLGLKQHPEIRPDLVVGHMTFGTMLFLRQLYPCPFIGYFEYLPPPYWTEQFAYRREYPLDEAVRFSNSVYNSFTHLHLHAVDSAYSPTHFQRSTAPRELQGKIRVLHDGVDAEEFQPRDLPRPFTFRGVTIDKNTRVVTYAARGLESMRGFDIFMKAAKRIQKEMDNVVFLIAGTENCYYGHELNYLPRGMTLKQWVLSQDEYDPARFHFLGKIPRAELAQLFNLSDLHFYLTVPFILSWSVVQAMASGCTILGSATPPVQEVIEDGVHGLLEEFYDVDGLARRALTVLKEPQVLKGLGRAARSRVLDRYEASKCLNALKCYFENAIPSEGR